MDLFLRTESEMNSSIWNKKGEFKEPVLVDTRMVVDSRNNRMQCVDKGKVYGNK